MSYYVMFAFDTYIKLSYRVAQKTHTFLYALTSYTLTSSNVYPIFKLNSLSESEEQHL